MFTPQKEPGYFERVMLNIERSIDPRVLGIVATVFVCVGLGVALVVLQPPYLTDLYDPFLTPLKVIPEWYLLPAFGLVKAAPFKLLGLGFMALVVGGLFLLPFIPDFSKRLPGGRLLGRSLFVAAHIAVATLGVVTLLE